MSKSWALRRKADGGGRSFMGLKEGVRDVKEREDGEADKKERGLEGAGLDKEAMIKRSITEERELGGRR